MRKTIAALLSLAMGVGATATAQDVISNPTGLVPNLAFQHIEPVLQEAGFTTERRNVNNSDVLLVRGAGKQLVLYPKACSAVDACGGVWVFAYINDTKPMEVINAFNQVSKPARASLVNGKVVLDRYLIADYGTARGSLVVNIGVMTGMIDQWFQYSKQNGPVAVSFTPLMGETPQKKDQDAQQHTEIELLRALSQNPLLINVDTSVESQLN